MLYRTRTYIAGAWTENQEAIRKLYIWNDNEHWALHFTDAHDLTQARDTSLPCTIKESLRFRMSGSKTFVLVVGNETLRVRKGGCQYCDNCVHTLYGDWCKSHRSIDFRSFIEFECDIAAKAYEKNEMRIVVLYDGLRVERNKCPTAVASIGFHIPMFYWNEKLGARYWNYSAIKEAIMG